MDEKLMKQLLAELIHSNGEALALLAAAVARQTNAEALLGAMRAQVEAARATKLCTATAVRMATQAMAAIEAEAALQARDRGTH